MGCEETLIDSSSDDTSIPKPLTSSSYVKCMLAEAMAEKSESEPEKESIER